MFWVSGFMHVESVQMPAGAPHDGDEGNFAGTSFSAAPSKFKIAMTEYGGIKPVWLAEMDEPNPCTFT